MIARPDIANLIERARERDPVAAAELAEIVERAIEHPEQRVGAALGLRRRKGGEPAWRAARRTERDGALRELAQLIGTDLSLEECADMIVRKATRYLAAPHCPADGDGAERGVLARIAGTGLPVPGLRHLKRILAEK
jgi:delta 1-pyrroline-5-carboxylate dehydrogenase